MKVAASAIVQAESGRVSHGSGSGSQHQHDGSFAQTFCRSICKSQGDSPPPASSLQATRATPSHGTSVAMPSAGRAAAALPSTAPSALPERARSHSAERPEAGGEETLDVLERRATAEHDANSQSHDRRQPVWCSASGTRECGAPAPSPLPAGAASATADGELAFPPAASVTGYAGGHARPAAGAPTGAEPTAASVRHLAAVGSPPVATQTTSRGHTYFVAAGRTSSIPADATPASEAAATAVLAATTDGTRLTTSLATPVEAIDRITPFAGVGTDCTPFLTQPSEHAPFPAMNTATTAVTTTTTATAIVPSSRASVARPARVFAIPLEALEPEPANPFGRSGMDTRPPRTPRAERAPVAAATTPTTAAANTTTTIVTAHAPTTMVARPARVFAIPLEASEPESVGTDSSPPGGPHVLRAPVAATPFGGFGTDSPPHLPTRASHAPVATTVPTATTDGAKPARVLATQTAIPVPTSETTRLVRNFAASAATSESQPATPFAGFGTDSPPHFSPHVSRAPVAATPFAGFGTDSPPQLPTRASHAPVATTVPTATTDGAKPARVLATQTAIPVPTSETTRLVRNFATSAATSESQPATPFAGLGTDSPPPGTHRAKHAPVAATVPNATADGARPAHVFARRPAVPTTAAEGTRATGASNRSSPAESTPARHRLASSPSDASAAVASPPAAAPVGNIASAAGQLTQPESFTQPAGLAPSSLPSIAPSAHSTAARSTEVPLAATGAREASGGNWGGPSVPKPLQGATGPLSRTVKPAPAGPPISTPTTAPPAPPAAETNALVAPAGQAPAQAGARSKETSAEEPARAQDGTDSPSEEASAWLAASVAAPNLPSPSSQTHHLRPAEIASVTEHVHAPRTDQGKQPLQAPAGFASIPLAHGQDGLRADAQATATVTQAPLQVTLPVPAPTASTPTSAPPTEPRAATHLPAHAASLAAQVTRDDGLSVTVLPHAAHMSIESPDGDLALHLRVRQGSAEISLGGSMAHLFATRAPEARAALASEGLALGRFDSGQQDGGQPGQPAPETPEFSGETPASYRPTQGSALPAPTEGRIHVTA